MRTQKQQNKQTNKKDKKEEKKRKKIQGGLTDGTVGRWGSVLKSMSLRLAKACIAYSRNEEEGTTPIACFSFVFCFSASITLYIYIHISPVLIKYNIYRYE